MLAKLPYSFSISKIYQIVDSDLIQQMCGESDSKIRSAVNQPTGDFFYDPWVIKSNLKNTVFEELLGSLPCEIGEARFAILKPGGCYQSHADIDDRYHLNLQGEWSYLIDLDSQTMFKTVPDGYWYTMDTSPHHVAANFGSIPRIQLVVRHLLTRNSLSDPILVSIDPIPEHAEKARFVFDEFISPWLNLANKAGTITDFETDLKGVKFKVEIKELSTLQQLIPKQFRLTVL